MMSGEGSFAHALEGSSVHSPLPQAICTRTWSDDTQGDSWGLRVGLGGYPLGFGGWDKGNWGLEVGFVAWRLPFKFRGLGQGDLGFRCEVLLGPTLAAMCTCVLRLKKALKSCKHSNALFLIVGKWR